MRTITAIYDSEAEARRAREQLVVVGLPDTDVTIVSQNLTKTEASGSDHDKGIWESIKDFFTDDDDRDAYSESLRRGGYLLTARVDDDLSDQTITVLEKTNAVDLDERSAQWRTEGWTGTAAGLASDTPDVGSATNRSADEEQAIPVVEERLRVGKREVDRGSVRVRSYVVEEPVHEEVSLREERVQVERRPVSDRSALAAAAFEDRTIELSERAEEAVVAKDAVVTEEVVVRKTSEERVEGIDETVRRTEVDVDDTRDATRTGGSSRSKKRV